MALFHFHVDQIGRSAGRSAVACAAYRSGEKLYSEYYGETSDYTRKGGVMYSEIMLPPHAPRAYADRQTLWNAVEKAERRHDAQLAYSFDIALQNELTFEENLEVARAFLLQYFVGDGMTVDFCVHDPERDGIQNPHFHVMVPIRPLNPDGTWGAKQHRVYHLDKNGERIRDEHGNYMFDAVATTDWGKPETLELWRAQWANMVNAKFEQKGLSCRIDHRSYEDQALDILPTVHEGPVVRQMEQKGIRTEKGELNRWIKATNRILKSLKQRIADLKLWIEVLREELGKQQTSQDLVRLIQDYYGERNRGTLHLPVYARQKARVGNLKRLNETVNYLSEHKLFTVEDLRKEMEQMEDARHILQEGTREKQERIKALKDLLRHAEAYEELKSLQEKLNTFKFKKQHRVYHLYKNGERIRDEHGNYMFDAVATTDWGKPETLELWRAQWANMVNAKFEQKGLSCRIDHRSYEDQALDILPTVHEGPVVRQMEQKGIRTEKGELNRWIKATNRILKSLKQRIADLKLWIEVLREELGKQQTSQDLVRLIQDYYGERNRGTLHLPVYARQKARVGNLKRLNETVNYLSEHKLFTVEDLRKEMEQMEDARHILQEGTREKQERIKALKDLLRHAEAYEELKSLQEKLNTFKFKKRREQFKQEHESDFRRFYLAKRKLKEAVPDGEPPIDVWKNELSQLEQEYRQQSAQASLLWKESKKLRELQVLVDEVLRKQGQHEREQQHSDHHQDKQEERLW